MTEERTDDHSEERGQSRRRFLKHTAAWILAGSFAGGVPVFGRPVSQTPPGPPAPFRSAWPAGVRRVWLGPEYWTNPLQDWRLHDGRLELVNAGARRNVYLLTRTLGARAGRFETSVRVGMGSRPGTGRAGFEVGIRGPLDDYRNAVIHGRGLQAGISTEGRLFVGDREGPRLSSSVDPQEGVRLDLAAEPDGSGYALVLSARHPSTGATLAELRRTGVPAADLEGGVALLADYEDAAGSPAAWGDPRLWFADWRLDGDKLEAYDDRAFGPILFAQHTLSRGVLKMTAQMPPLGGDEAQTVRLEADRGDGWERVAEAPIDELARTATFRVEGWDASRAVPYRLVYALSTARGIEETTFEGTIRREPTDRDELVVGGFSCATDAGFPHMYVAEGAAAHDPDVLAFTGDQLYESSGGYGVQRHRENVPLSTLDYLRKWYMHGWAFGELMRDRPTICMPDDHDVYHGNIWGEGGEAVSTWEEHNEGGYFMPAEWVAMVHRTQTAHLPDPYDPTPIEQGIPVYYTDMLYGRVSFGIVEDRKWKTGPEGAVPPNPGRPDHIAEGELSPAELDAPGAVLLGDRQHVFLDDWAADWAGADMKVVVSQSALAAVPTHHGEEMMHLIADLDANGWPKTPRDEALRRFRKAFAFHLGGDQHLPMVVRYGIDEFEDAGFNYCVPAISTGYPRWFMPEARLEEPGEQPYTGRYVDGFGNPLRVTAVANPATEFRRGVLERLVDKSSGYGIVRLDRRKGEITMEAWPILSDPRGGPAAQYAGWPQTIRMTDNDGRAAVGYLPRIVAEGDARPMVQVVEEATGEIVYTLRVPGQEFRPPVYADGSYTVRIGDDVGWRQSHEQLRPGAADGETLRVRL